MPNSIGVDGVTTKTREELITELTLAYEAIYGDDINADPDSPDGETIGIFAQIILDGEDLMVQINAMFDPDQAVGRILDQRVAINGIQRKGGTFTITNVTITTDRALSLQGIDSGDGTDADIFTVQDNAGTQWKLITSYAAGGAGSYALAFRAAQPGAVLTVPNTIQSQVTIVLGVTVVNNPTTYTTLGINEETDNQLKIRRQQSVALSSQGYYAGLKAALLNLNGVTDAFIYENTTGATDGLGVPSHSIWVIVAGTATPAQIANAIYTKRNAGCGMKGDQTFNISQADGSIFTVRWDDVTPETLFIKFTATSLDGINAPNIAAIRAGLVTSFVPGVAMQVDINELATKVQAIDPNTLVTGAGFSSTVGGAYTNTKTPASKDKQFAVIAADIVITPMILSPTTVALAMAAQQQFTPLGGYGAMTYSIPVNNSGGTIDVNGLYTAGGSPGVDTVRVTDSLSNTADATVTVS